MSGTILLSLLLTLLLFGLFRRLRRALHTPVRLGRSAHLTLHLRVEGAAPELEAAADGLLWLLSDGVLPGRLVIEDAGMDAETRRVAEYLTKDNDRIELWMKGTNNGI